MANVSTAIKLHRQTVRSTRPNTYTSYPLLQHQFVILLLLMAAVIVKQITAKKCSGILSLLLYGRYSPGGGVLKLVRIKSLKKKITLLVQGFIVVVIDDVKIV